MIKFITFLILVTIVAVSSVFLTENSGNIEILWLGYRIDTSVAFTLVSILLSAVLLYFLISILFFPARYLQRRSVRQLQKGLTEITYSVAALAASDIATAEAHTNKAQKLLGKTPLTTLLSAQIAKSRGDDSKTQVLLEKLLDYKETEYLAARSLSENAALSNNIPKALAFSKQASELNKGDASAALKLISLQAYSKQWEEAFATLNKSKLPRGEKKRINALINLSMSKFLLDSGDNEQALSAAKLAIAYFPSFAPAAAITARCYASNENLNKAIKTLQYAWKKQPTTLLTETFASIIASEPPASKERLQKLLPDNASDGVWHCKNCKNSQKSWELHCGSCHAFDSLEYQAN